MKAVCYVGSAVLAAALLGGARIAITLSSRLDPQIISNCGYILSTILLAVFVISLLAGSSAQGLSKDFSFQFRLIAFIRTPLLMFIVVPLSFLSWIHSLIRDRVRVALLDTSAAAHQKRVDRIVGQVQKWNKAGRPSILRTARPNWAAMSTKLSSNKGDSHRIMTHDLTSILSVDFENMTITAEPGVNMGQITHYLVPKGYALLIQVEMESLTIGGLSMGFGMETNSHVVGFFQESVVKYEMVLCDGRVQTVTEASDPELFFALPWSCGTLGFLTAVTAKIVKVKPFMHVTYIPTYTNKEFASKLKELSESPNPPAFLEATVYSLETAVIQVAEFADVTTPEQKRKVHAINWWWKPFYYKWVETFIKKGEGKKGKEREGDEYIPLLHFYHRFTRSIFWEIEEMIPFSNHPLYRFFWGWMGAPEVSLLKLFQGPAIRKASVEAHVVQESIMPIQDLEEGVEKYDEWFGVYPLLVFPLRVYDRGDLSGFLHPTKRNLVPGTNWGIWVDLGAYGTPREVRNGRPWSAKKVIREMEAWTRERGGFQAYYTDLFCTRKEFRQMYDHTLLDKCRKRLNATDAFPEVYDKIRPEAGIVDLKEEEEREREKQENSTN
mmetsp:Transcript_22729/g.22928  ORF Transcript_22729/g.22928 Transcript_22729/m.22928 type:complete len:609 (-) Transcript_22729:1029-2855(-)